MSPGAPRPPAATATSSSSSSGSCCPSGRMAGPGPWSAPAPRRRSRGPRSRLHGPRRRRRRRLPLPAPIPDTRVLARRRRPPRGGACPLPHPRPSSAPRHGRQGWGGPAAGTRGLSLPRGEGRVPRPPAGSRRPGRAGPRPVPAPAVLQRGTGRPRLGKQTDGAAGWDGAFIASTPDTVPPERGSAERGRAVPSSRPRRPPGREPRHRPASSSAVSPPPSQGAPRGPGSIPERVAV